MALHERSVAAAHGEWSCEKQPRATGAPFGTSTAHELESAFETGQPTWSEDLLLVLDRNLPQEETYFTFSYSAIPGVPGTVDGIFCACTETPERVLSERRLRTLRDLASRASEARSAEEACEIAAHLPGNNAVDIPFALIYLLDHERTVAQLVALSGLSPSHQAAPATIALSS